MNSGLEESPVSARIAGAGVVVAAVAVAGQTAIHLFNAWALDYRWGFLDVASDEDLFAWASAVATAVAAVGALLIAVASRQPRLRNLVLAALLAFLSLDDIAKLHEALGGRIADRLDLWDNADRLVWPVIYLPILALILLLLIEQVRPGPERARRMTWAGIGLLAAAIALEVVSQGLYELGLEEQDWPIVLEVVAEEGAELGGWILIGTALLAISSSLQWRWAATEAGRPGSGPGAGLPADGMSPAGSGASSGTRS